MALPLQKFNFSKLITLSFDLCRSISTTSILNGKKNFKKFMLYNKRGNWAYKHSSKRIRYDLGVRSIMSDDKRSRLEPEKIPELIVPDLTDFKLKPYVSYKVPEVVQSEFTSQDLFNACYAPKIIEDYKHDRLNENEVLGSSPEEAWVKARQTGSDMFYAKLDLENLRYK